ncbi:MAG: ABC transporter ATP-binding protein [Planctomycetes bacterium]|nr:ABC transporter ATP-binding protein [Planctomycetota bacterium]
MPPAPPPAAAATPAAAPVVRTGATLRRLLARFRPHRGRAVGVGLLYLVRTGLMVATPALLGEAVGAVSDLEGAGGDLPPRFVLYTGLYALAIVLRAVVFFLVTTAAAALAQDVEGDLRRELFATTMRLRFRWHDENRSGKTIARALRDMERTKQFYREAVFGAVEVVLVVGGVTAWSWVVGWPFGVAATVLFGGVFVAMAAVGRRIATLDRAMSDHYDRVTTTLQENVAGARVVRAFGRESDEVARFSGRLGRFSEGWRGLSRFWSTALPVVNHTTWLVVPAALLAGVVHVAAAPGPQAVGETVGVLLAMRLARDMMRQTTRLVLMNQEAVASATRVFEVLDNGDVLAPPAAPGVLPPGGGDLRLEDVTFAYPDGRPVLRGVSLHVPAGGSLGLLGRTGAGKTTLVHLLPRFYDPSEGRVLLDGTDVSDLDPTVLARSIGLVFQEPFLFSATVADNVAYGDPSAGPARVERACRLAAAHEFVERLPKGYATVVGERGVSLSGGQRQRLTIARAVLLDPRVLVFDDATASVDAITEKELFRGIRDAAKGRTTLVISQRVSSVRWCDRIAVLEDGRVTALGTHDELLTTSALYREIHHHQTAVGGTS